MVNTSYNINTGATEVAAAFAPRIKGKTVLITGANPAGLGLAFARAAAAQGPELIILTYRTDDKADQIRIEFAEKFPSVRLVFVKLDLTDYDSIREAAKALDGITDHINILVNNAGIMSVPERTLTKNGVELQFATNHVGHFLFTNLILDKLITAAKTSEPGSTRIVNLSGGWHQFSPVRFSDLNFAGVDLPEEERPNKDYLAQFGHKTDNVYIGEVAYAQSKSANIMFSVYLTEHLRKYDILSFGINPGGVFTEIARYLPQAVIDHLLAMNVANKTPDTGAAPVMVAALDPTLTADTQPYFHEDCQPTMPQPWTTDRALVEKLWHVSEELVGQTFDLSAK